MIWWAGGNPFHHHQDLNRLLRAWSRAETIVVQEPWWTAARPPCRHRAARHHHAGAQRHRQLLARPLRPRHAPGDPAQSARRATTSTCWPTSPMPLGFRDRFTEQRDEDRLAAPPLRPLAPGLRRRRASRRRTSTASGPPAMSRCRRAARRGLHPVRRVPRRPGGAPAQHALRQGRDVLRDHRRASAMPDCPGHPVWQRAARMARRRRRRGDYPLHLLSFQPATRLHGQLDTGRVAAADKIAGPRADPDAPRRCRRARPARMARWCASSTTAAPASPGCG